mmetsp:Transcript_6145/g.13480  ORF Transcript_6145/g.13480 Transcript_6145/m.13480 type:complete len:83 (-) Transcript_6145:993-1241(-)
MTSPRVFSPSSSSSAEGALSSTSQLRYNRQYLYKRLRQPHLMKFRQSGKCFDLTLSPVAEHGNKGSVNDLTLDSLEFSIDVT